MPSNLSAVRLVSRGLLVAGASLAAVGCRQILFDEPNQPYHSPASSQDAGPEPDADIVAGGARFAFMGDPVLDLGAVFVGSPATELRVSMANSGNTSGVLPSLSLKGDAFRIVSSTCSGSLSPNATCELVIAFEPTLAGHYVARLGGSGLDAKELRGTGRATVQVLKDGDAKGVVSSNSPGLDCGPTCTAVFDVPEVTLSAVDDGVGFMTGWAGACSGKETCTLVLDGPKVVRSTFRAPVVRSLASDDESRTYPIDMVAGDAGTFYFLGRYDDASRGFPLVKFDRDGATIWRKRLVLEGVDAHYPDAAFINRSGILVIVGSVMMKGAFRTFRGAFSPTGTQLSLVVDAPHVPELYVSSIAPGSDGSVIAVGATSNGLAYVQSADLDGNEKWFTTLPGDGRARDRASEVAVDAAGNVLAVGYVAVNDDRQRAGFLAQFDATGKVLWQKRSVVENTFRHSLRRVKLDKEGNIFVTADTTATVNDSVQWMVMKFDRNGNTIWQLSESSGVQTSEARALTLDAKGNPIVVGYVAPDGSPEYTPTIRKYSTRGDRLWQRNEVPLSLQNAVPFFKTVAIDSDGNIVTTGRDPSTYSAFVRKYFQ